jgi:hypothetical protein
MVERFRIPINDKAPDISITDRENGQGVRLAGQKNLAEASIRLLWETLLDMVVRRDVSPEDPAERDRDRVIYDLEFPGASKTALDGLRARVRPTLTNHHRLRIIASDHLDLIEQRIERTPHNRNRLEFDLMERVVYQPLRKHGRVRFEHVKPEGQTATLREGEIISLEASKLTLKRRFHTGRYDGLDLAIEHGDYAITEVLPDRWYLSHRYFAKDGRVKGHYWNVNTPIELYPDRVRYVDLHVDVVRRAKELPGVIDQSKLESITRKGLISTRLQHEALDVAGRLLKQMAYSK